MDSHTHDEKSHAINLNLLADRIGFFSKKLLLNIVPHERKTPAVLNIIFCDEPSFGHFPVVHLFGNRQDTADIVLPGFCFSLHIVPPHHLRVDLSHRRTLDLDGLDIIYFRNNGSSGFIAAYSYRGMPWTKYNQILPDLAHTFPHQVAKPESPTQQNHDGHNPPDDPEKSEGASKPVRLQIFEGLSYDFRETHDEILDMQLTIPARWRLEASFVTLPGKNHNLALFKSR